MYTPFIRSSKENPFPKKLNKLCPRERQTRPRVNQNELFQAFQSHHRPLHTSLAVSLSLFLSIPLRSCLLSSTRSLVYARTYVRACVRVREFNARRTGRTMPCMDTMGIVRSESE